MLNLPSPETPTARQWWERCAPDQHRFALRAAEHGDEALIESMFGDLVDDLAIHWQAQYDDLLDVDLAVLRDLILCQILPLPDFLKGMPEVAR